jgi:hypothetical protein
MTPWIKELLERVKSPEALSELLVEQTESRKSKPWQLTEEGAEAEIIHPGLLRDLLSSGTYILSLH